MSKPARLYPKPEPVIINPRLLSVGSLMTGLIFVIIYGVLT